jgi:carbonic anhydrase
MADTMHVDVKVPSEHLIHGERFDAEMQVFHLHAESKRMPTVTVMIRAVENGYNYYFQELIDAFDVTFRQNQARCVARQRHERRRLHTRTLEQSIGYNHSDPSENITTTALIDFSNEANSDKDHQRKLQNDDIWDPLHVMLVPTIHFYRYDGSITEPPCGEWVSWFVADTPMIISLEQLERLKTIMFLNVDENCHRTSVQFGHSVARPVQETAGRPVWQCTEQNFGPDP